MVFTKRDMKRFQKASLHRYYNAYEKKGVLFKRDVVVRQGAIVGFILDRIIPCTGILLTVIGNKYGKTVYKTTTRKDFGKLECVMKPFLKLAN